MHFLCMQKAGKNPSKLFSRDLTAMYSTGTIVTADMDCNQTEANYLLCIHESMRKGSTSVEFGIMVRA